ncbi:hypothetical protein [Enterococcus sp. AZ126]|uniref:hypothetical protein n=1 Tax=Enterococcus sp. AZ126 TaxID=2774635 RepID=UPI003F26AAA2
MITTDPADASDSIEVITATTAETNAEMVVTIVKNENGSFDASITGEGAGVITFTSGEFTTTVSVTGQTTE